MHFQLISIIQKTLFADSIRGETGESKKIFSIYNPESKLSVGIPGHSCEQEKAGRGKMVESELLKEPGLKVVSSQNQFLRVGEGAKDSFFPLIIY